MTKVLNPYIEAGSKKSNEPRLIGSILADMLHSNEPFAMAYRERLLKHLFPNTELCIDLKLLTRKPGSLNIGDSLSGSIVHDDERHFTFLEGVQDKKPVNVQRNPRVYEGRLINVVSKEDGTMRPTLKYPKYTEGFGFQDYCIAVAKELIEVSSLGENK